MWSRHPVLQTDTSQPQVPCLILGIPLRVGRKRQRHPTQRYLCAAQLAALLRQQTPNPTGL